MLVSIRPTLPEEYLVKYWYKDDDSGYYKQGLLTVYASSKGAHEYVEKFALKALREVSNVRVISVTYQ